VHAPGRKTRNYRRDQLSIPMPDLAREIELLEAFSGSRVVGLAVNHEGLGRADVERVSLEYRERFRLPVCDPLVDGCGELVAAVRSLL